MNPTQRAWAYVSRKRLRNFILFLIFIRPFGRNFSLFDSDEVQQNSRKQSLQIAQYIFFR